MKKHKCSVGKIVCPYWDMDSRDEEWCQSQWLIYGFERCPIPKQRNEKIKVFKKEGYNDLHGFICSRKISKTRTLD